MYSPVQNFSLNSQMANFSSRWSIQSIWCQVEVQVFWKNNDMKENL